MSYDIILRFPDKETANEFAGQMSDRAGEGFCDFSFWRQKEGTTGKTKMTSRRLQTKAGAFTL